jgi:hypothetical protein
MQRKHEKQPERLASRLSNRYAFWSKSRLKALMHPEAIGCQPKLDATTRKIIALAVTTEAMGEVMAIFGLLYDTNAIAEGYHIEPVPHGIYDALCLFGNQTARLVNLSIACP